MSPARRTSCTVVVVLAVLAGAACSDGGGSGGSGTSVSNGSDAGAGSDVTTDDTTDDTTDGTTDGTGASGTGADGSTGTTSATGSSVRTTVPRTVAPTIAPTVPPAGSDPAATAPNGGNGDGDLGPPADDCVDAPAGTATVELSVTDDDVVYAAAVAPSCVRIHAAQTLTVRNAASGDTTVDVGGESHTLAAGTSFTSPALGAIAEIGDTFDVYVEELGVTVLVQVLP